MFKFENLVILLTLISIVFGASVIDSELNIKDVFVEDLISNDIDQECSNLTPELIKEIKSHQPIVDQITSAIVNGKYSG